MKIKTKIPLDILQYFEYDERCISSLLWKVDRVINGRVIAMKGECVTSLSKNGYYKVGINRVQYLAHRIIYLMHFPCWDQLSVIDHIDGNRGNNNITNLRAVTPSLNQRNTSKRSDNTSGVTGVSYNKSRERWRVVWTDMEGVRQYKNFPIKQFSSVDEAYKKAVEFRENILLQLNNNGAGYTDRHGKSAS